MSDDNIIPFPGGDRDRPDCDPMMTITTDHSDLSYTISWDELDLNLMDFNPLDNDVIQDIQQQQLESQLLRLQDLCEQYPDITQFVHSHLDRFIQNMENRVK